MPAQSIYDPSFAGYGYSDPTKGHVYGRAWEPQTAPAPTPTPTGDVLGTQAPTGPSPEELEAQRREGEARGAIESGYSGYFSQLDAMLGEGLPAQEAAQKGIAKSQYGQGAADLLSQKTEGMGLLGKQEEKTQETQARNLKDIAANLRNAFTAGNVFLGARGAGDSSAGKMYSYALTKMGSKQRGDIMKQTSDIMSEIGDREAKLQNIYTDETKRQKSDYDQKILGISSWFAEQQNAIRQARATGEISKGQDLASLSQTLLNQALNQVNYIKQETSNKKAALEEWAMNNATTINEVKSNLQ